MVTPAAENERRNERGTANSNLAPVSVRLNDEPTALVAGHGNRAKHSGVLGRIHSEPERSVQLTEQRSLQPPIDEPSHRSCPEIGPEILLRAADDDESSKPSHLWSASGSSKTHARVLDSRLEHSFLTRVIAGSRESVCASTQALALNATELQPLVGKSERSACESAGAGSGHGVSTSRAAGQRMLENETIGAIAVDTLRINGVLRSFKYLRHPTTTSSTLSIPTAMKKMMSSDSEPRDGGLTGVSAEHPKNQRSFASNSVESEKRKSTGGGGGGPAGFHRPNGE